MPHWFISLLRCQLPVFQTADPTQDRPTLSTNCKHTAAITREFRRCPAPAPAPALVARNAPPLLAPRRRRRLCARAAAAALGPRDGGSLPLSLSRSHLLTGSAAHSHSRAFSRPPRRSTSTRRRRSTARCARCSRTSSRLRWTPRCVRWSRYLLEAVGGRWLTSGGWRALVGAGARPRGEVQRRALPRAGRPRAAGHHGAGEVSSGSLVAGCKYAWRVLCLTDAAAAAAGTAARGWMRWRR